MPSRLQPEFTISQEHVGLTARRPARVCPCLFSKDYPPHDHAYYELVLITGGSASHLTSNSSQQIRPGTFIVAPPRSCHAYQQCDGLQALNFYYLVEWLLNEFALPGMTREIHPIFWGATLFRSPSLSQVVCFDLQEPACQSIHHEFEQLQAESESLPDSPFLLRLLTIKLLALLSRQLRLHHKASHQVQLSPRSYHILDYVEEALDQRTPFDLAQLARRCSLSPSHLSRSFRQELGLSPMAYFQRRRSQLACRLLLQEDSSLSEIAHDLGFADASHFSNRFKATTGLSPRAYRKRHQHRPPSPATLHPYPKPSVTPSLPL